MVLTFALAFIPIIGTIGIIIAALVTLCKSVTEGAILTIAATLPYVLSLLITDYHAAAVPLVIWAGIGIAVLSNALTWAFAVMLAKKTNWSSLIQIAALLGVLLISVIHLGYADVAGWWGKQLQSYYMQAQAMAGAVKNQAITATEMQAHIEAINMTKQYATGFMVAGLLLHALLQLLVAKWWQAKVYNPGHLRRELHWIRLSHLAGVLFVISLVLSYLGNSVVLDIMPVLYLLFCIAGLSLVHYLFGLMTSSTKWFWLAIFYVTLILAIPTSVILVAILALMDTWLDVRKRIIKV